MATNRVSVGAAPEQVFATLSDPDVYGEWVVGSDTIRDVDPAWPVPGSRFHHRIGYGPLKVNDHTEVISADPPRTLVLRARARPLGTAKITLQLEPENGGTLLTMRETAGDALSRLGLNPLTDWLVHLRNHESLRRLKRIAESAANARVRT